MERLVTDSVVEAVAAKVADKLKAQMLAQWGAVLTQLADTQESNRKLQSKLNVLEQAVQGQTSEIETLLDGLSTDLTQNRMSQRKAASVLNAAYNALGLGT